MVEQMEVLDALLHTTKTHTLITKIIQLTTPFKRLCTTDSFGCQLQKVGPINYVAIENMVLQMVAKNPHISICTIEQELGISYMRVI